MRAKIPTYRPAWIKPHALRRCVIAYTTKEVTGKVYNFALRNDDKKVDTTVLPAASSSDSCLCQEA